MILIIEDLLQQEQAWTIETEGEEQILYEILTAAR